MFKTILLLVLLLLSIFLYESVSIYESEPAVTVIKSEYSPPPTPYDLGDISILYDLINEYRVSNGLGALTTSSSLVDAAKCRANYLNDKDIFSHDNFRRCFNEVGIDPYRIGENLAKDFADYEFLFSRWKNSPLHNEVMLSPNFKFIGLYTINTGVHRNITVLSVSDEIK